MGLGKEIRGLSLELRMRLRKVMWYMLRLYPWLEEEGVL